MSVSAEPVSATGVVVVTGAAGALGRRVGARLADDPAVGRVVELDRRTAADRGEGPVDLLTDGDLKARMEGADVVVHLATAFGPLLDDDPEVVSGADVEMARRVLDAAAAAGVPHVVVLSSATVYGAWANNPVPLTEDSPLRPDPGLAFAVQKAEVERLALEWRDGHPGTTVAVLRPALAVAGDHPGWMGRALRAATSVRGLDDNPPLQFLHLDDLAAAVDHARTARLDGPFNVAPDGWLTPTEFSQLAGGAARLRAPRAVVDRLASLRWRLRLAPVPPAVQAYAAHPWVVANDRLRATGWAPTARSEEAYVEATPAGPWATLSPTRRQELALGGTAAAAVGAAGAALVLVRRRSRRP